MESITGISNAARSRATLLAEERRGRDVRQRHSTVSAQRKAALTSTQIMPSGAKQKKERSNGDVGTGG